MDVYDDPVITTARGFAMPRTEWALVQDGIIVAVAKTYSEKAAPFAGVPTILRGDVPLSGNAAIRVTGIGAMLGHLVDSRGNVTPAEGRTTALTPGVPAYYDGARSRERSLPTAVAMDAEMGAIDPEPAPEIPPPDNPAE